MNLDQFVAWATGQSLLYPPNPEDDRGQCYQLINFYMARVWGTPLIWKPYAYQLIAGAQAMSNYTVTINNPNDANQVPPVGAIMVFGANLPGSGGMGHTDIFLQATGVNAWIGFDSNWGGKTAHKVTHNYSYVVGWITPRGGLGGGPAPAPAPSAGGDEVIANADQATKIYKMLRPNGGGSQDEIGATAGRRTYANFVNDAQAEINQRDANLVAQNQQLANMQTTIDQLNAAVTAANSNDQADLQKIAELTAELTTAHDQLKDLQDALPKPPPTPTADEKAAARVGLFTKLIALFLKLKKKQ
jgi:hypothetical protein